MRPEKVCPPPQPENSELRIFICSHTIKDVRYFSHHVHKLKLSLDAPVRIFFRNPLYLENSASLKVKSLNGPLGSASWPTELKLVYICVCVSKQSW